MGQRTPVGMLSLPPRPLAAEPWGTRRRQVAEIRARLRAALPGAPVQQTSILHLTLARLAGGAAAVSAAAGRADAVAACAAATERLSGLRLIVSEVRPPRLHGFACQLLSNCDGKLFECMLSSNCN